MLDGSTYPRWKSSDSSQLFFAHPNSRGCIRGQFCHQQAADGALLIDLALVPLSPVYDVTIGRDEYLAGVQGGYGQADGQDHDGDGLDEAEGTVDTQVQVPVFRFSRVTESPVGPEVEPVVGANGGPLIDELHPKDYSGSNDANIL